MSTRGGRKKIALIVENIFTDFAGGLIQAVRNATHLYKNVDLIVISGQYDMTKEMDEHYRDYLTTYNAIYQLQLQCEFDGVIICLGSMIPSNVELIDRWVRNNTNIPTVFTVCEIEGHVSVNYDNAKGIREAVDCLLNIHGFKHFAMMGGREDNFDSQQRKRIFAQALAEGGVVFEEKNYIPTDMFIDTQEEARILLDRNPDVQAIFCVNDSVAVGLYREMERRRLIPGKDIMIFGFDNTMMAAHMMPSLSSVGAGNETMGKKALELLLNMINGEQVESALVDTRFYGRESLPYSMYEFATLDWSNVSEDMIYHMFDECFYRYKPEFISREALDLRRLFKEFTSRVLLAVKHQYMSAEDFHEARDMIRIFFENGALQYTDSEKLVAGINRFHASINLAQSANGMASLVYVNRLFSYARDCVILSLAKRISDNKEELTNSRRDLLDYMVDVADYGDTKEDILSRIILNFDKLNMKDAALFLFNQPIEYEKGVEDFFPEMIRLCCLTKDGELYVISEERRSGRLNEMYQRRELIDISRECATFPIFFKHHYYGFVVSKLDSNIANSGEFLACQIGRAIYMYGEKLS